MICHLRDAEVSSCQTAPTPALVKYARIAQRRRSKFAVSRGILFDGERLAHDLSGIRNRADGAGGNRLHHEVADGGGFDGAGDDAAARGIGGHLAEAAVLRAAADDMDRLDPAAASKLLQPAEHLPVLEGQALQGARG